MTVGQDDRNKTNLQNPLIDTGNVTVNAFNAIRKKEKSDANITLGKDDITSWTSPNFKVKVKAWTQVDNKTHTYFHSLSIDVNVEDFMGTAELKCPYDSDLMSYWEPIRQTVVIYGANRGDYKILFIGRVRGVKQDGYELVIEFQNYAWKFKQLVSQSYAQDNVFNKDGYTILRLMFEALKIDSWVISPSAKHRLKQVGINEDGNLTVNGKEIEEIPDLFKRIKSSNPSKVVNKDTLNNKLREKYLHNIKHINYTLKYEKPTAVMKKIASQGSYTAGNNVYSNAYGSASGGGTGGGGVSDSEYKNSLNSGCNNAPGAKSFCPNAPSSQWSALETVWKYNRGCVDSYTNAKNVIVNYATTYASHYLSQIDPCLATMSSYTKRSDGGNAASDIRSAANSIAHEKTKSGAQRTVENLAQGAMNAVAGGAINAVSSVITFSKQVGGAINYGINKAQQIGGAIGGAIWNAITGR